MPVTPYDAVLVLSFGGPEKPEDVMPFLENVLRGRNVPRERLLEVAEHYHHFNGRSPINDQNRELVTALKAAVPLPVYWGNRNWHPFLADTMRQMEADGVKHALAYVTSSFSSYSGCRQYREDVERARAEIGAGAPQVDKLRSFYNHPLFIETLTERAGDALGRLSKAEVLFTAHSVPLSMADSSDYVKQLHEACRLVSEKLDLAGWRLVYQSRSGPPAQPWLEPDVCEVLREMEAGSEVVIVPIGFVSDHMEVLYDLDTEARQVCLERGIQMERALTPGSHPKFIAMITELIAERMGGCPKRAIGNFGPNHDVCPQNCCPAPPRMAARPSP
jgi:protoporphyrin/coproporphyrin ferrochelatase